MRALDPSSRRELERLFDEDAPPRLRRLAAALLGVAAGTTPPKEAAFEAHALRGAAATVGRVDLARLSGSVEDLLEEADPDPAELRAAARLVSDAEHELGSQVRSESRPFDRFVPRRFMTRFALILAFALIPAFGIALYDAIHNRTETHQRAVEEVRSSAQLAATAEQELITGGEQLLNALSQVPAIRLGEPGPCGRVFATFNSRFASYPHIALVAGNGRVICASMPTHPRSPAADPSIMKVVHSVGGFVVGPLEKDPTTGRYAVAIAEPLRRSPLHGAYLVGSIAAAGIERLIAQVPLPPGSAIAVFDREGSVIARRPDPARYVGTRSNIDATRALYPVAGTATAKGIDGVRRTFAYRAAGPWYVSVGIPTAPADAMLTRQLVYELLLLAGLGGVGLVLGVVSARRVLGRPLAALVSTARRLEGGDLSARTGMASRGGELAELAASIDAMAASLQRRTEERERITAELDERVQERTAELESAREVADQSSRAKSAFLSRLSHELRTPLNAIRGFAQLLEIDDLPPDQAEAASHIASGANHMTKLVEELLDTARIEAGEFRVELEPLAVAAVVDEVVDLSRGLAADHDVTLASSFANPGIGVLADRGRLRQALLNLVTNAIVYNRRGGTVSVRTSRPAEGRVRIDVLDTGEGIAANDFERVFAPYDRLGRGAESSGLGLGLSLSKRIVEAMAGTIAVDSERGVGTRFTIELPAARVPGGPTDIRELSDDPARGVRRVLYIEDNAMSMKLVELLLRGRNVVFRGASTAAEGIAAAREEAPDLILLDLQLPDGSGEDVLRTLRAEPSLRAVPIVMLSAQASRETMRRVLEAGADDYLTKPLEVDRAGDVIERFLRREN